jgi:hypothetical protein
MSKKELINILYQNISEADYYTLGVAIHKTHKKKKMKIKNTFLEDIYKDRSREMVVKKSTQSGISEYLIVRSIARARQKKNIFYVLPTFDLKNAFVKERFYKSLLYTNYYQQLLKENETRNADSMSMIMLGGGTIAFVGSNTEVAFISYPADDVYIDEYDKCNQQNIAMAPERQSASDDKYSIKIANPTFNNFGIDTEYKNSDQKKWFIKCDGCGKYIHPDFFKHVVREEAEGIYVIRDKEFDRFSGNDIKPICHKCNKPYNRKKYGIWVKQQEHIISGYQISKMFSSTEKLYELVDKLEKGLTNEIWLQRLYNGDLGLSFTAKGACIDTDMLNKCVRDYVLIKESKNPCIMGIDVGKVFNIVIREVLPDGRLKAVYIGEEPDIKDVYDLYTRFNVKCAVIDAMPESRLSKKFAYNFKGAFRCYYGTDKKDNINIQSKIVQTDRTQILDSVKEAIIIQKYLLPKNAQNIKNYYRHMCASTRYFDEKRNKYIWTEGNEPDHYFHAEAYCLIAYRILSMIKGV